jgi:dienelactone hydrolase
VIRSPALVIALAISLAGCGSARLALPPSSGPVVLDDDGAARKLAARLCRPSGSSPAPLVVINHGAPTRPEDIPLMQPTGCDSEPARWFTSRGYVVAFALRRGFGASEGNIAEDSGPCEAPDYLHAGQEGARDIDAVVGWAETLPGVRRDATVVVGQSTGGWAALAYAARADASVVAVVNMAGGRGGRAFDAAGTYCHVENLVASAGAFGAAARVPALWIYASNDSWFTPDVATAMHDAYVAAGGRAEFVRAAPFGSEGHQLFYGAGGSAEWGPLIAPFLHAASRGPTS